MKTTKLKSIFILFITILLFSCQQENTLKTRDNDIDISSKLNNHEHLIKKYFGNTGNVKSTTRSGCEQVFQIISNLFHTEDIEDYQHFIADIQFNYGGFFVSCGEDCFITATPIIVPVGPLEPDVFFLTFDICIEESNCSITDWLDCIENGDFCLQTATGNPDDVDCQYTLGCYERYYYGLEDEIFIYYSPNNSLDIADYLDDYNCDDETSCCDFDVNITSMYNRESNCCKYEIEIDATSECDLTLIGPRGQIRTRPNPDGSISLERRICNNGNTSPQPIVIKIYANVDKILIFCQEIVLSGNCIPPE